MASTKPHRDEHVFYEQVARRYLGAGALITDTDDRILVVEPVYKSTWEIPGGLVEAEEAPRNACARELLEELGLVIWPGRLLVMDHQTLPQPRGDSLMFIYDGGTLTNPEMIVLQDSELRSYRFLEADELEATLPPRLAGRMVDALIARQHGTLIERKDGQRIGGA